MRRSSPKAAVHSISQASSVCSCTWLCTNRVETSGSMPTARSSWASSRVGARSSAGSCGTVQGVQVDHAVQRVGLVLVDDPVAQRPEQVAQVDGPVGWMPEKTRVMGGDA